MKKIILFIAFFSMLTKGFNQQVEEPKMELTKQEYLKKSKSQKTAGRILLGGGGILIGAGLLTNLSNGLGNLFVEESQKNSSGDIFTVLGVISIGGSIPLFISAGKNKRKAISLSVKNQPSQVLQNNQLYTKMTPSLTFKINL
ncbi:MAG: hypothetical protein IPN82_01275 [Chitinophagaceae bacterium]|nr:hypothetical protein [Chitinophagaceae bacterium]